VGTTGKRLTGEAGVRERFVGLGSERAVFRQALEEARSGRAALVCVEGRPGIGKTALVRAFLVDVNPETVVAASGDEAEAALAWGALG
jgi:predicted ATPase